MKEKNNGITLIALIITIIVMLILVAVAINLAVNGGLFGYAGNATKDTETAKDEELTLSNGIIGGKTIEDWVGGNESLLPNSIIPSSGVYLRMGDMTSYYSEITNTEKTIIATMFNSYGYSGVTIDNFTKAGETPPEGRQTMDIYLYGDYVYVYNYNPGSGIREGWTAKVWNKQKEENYGELLNSINGENLTHMLGTFYQCTTLITVPRIPNSVTDIESLCEGCTSLTTAPTIPSSVTIIGADAFRECISLKSITIPKSVTSIGDSTFRLCTSLTSVTIPKSVTSIESYIFDNCVNLTSITYQGTKSEWYSIDLDSQWNGWSSITTLHCADGDIIFDENRY